MKNEIVSILAKANLDKDFICYVENEMEMDVKLINKNPYEGEFPNYAVVAVSPKQRLFWLLVELIKLKQFYLKKHIPDHIFYDSLDDLNYRVNRYYNTHKSYGLSQRDVLWLRFVYFGETFTLGSLRYQKFIFTFEEVERSGAETMYFPDHQKQRFPEGTPMINVHILGGTDLSPARIDESFNLARQFFAKYFPEHNYAAFICRTWMLYTPTQQILKKDSNITHFANRFEIIAQSENRRQALTRIYGTLDIAEIEKMEKKSSLAKLAYKNIDKLGVAAGVILA